MAQDNQDDLRDPVRVHFDEVTGYLVVQVDKTEYGFVDREARYQGKAFLPKEELHITVVSREAAEALAQHIQQPPENAGPVHSLIDSTRWSYRKLDRYYHIQDGEEETIIEMVELPELNGFFSQLSRLTGQGLLLPPTHVTLYTYQSEKGIGLPTGEVFEQLARAEIRPEDFLGQEGA